MGYGRIRSVTMDTYAKELGAAEFASAIIVRRGVFPTMLAPGLPVAPGCWSFLVVCFLLGIRCLNATAQTPVAPTVYISEFMAANSQTLVDEDGDYSDWIELFNSGPGTAHLV